jgi:hypothetical protein
MQHESYDYRVDTQEFIDLDGLGLAGNRDSVELTKREFAGARVEVSRDGLIDCTFPALQGCTAEHGGCKPRYS